MNRKSKLRNLIALAGTISLLFGCGISVSQHTEDENVSDDSYGVFLGANREEISALYAYETVVIEPSEFLKGDIEVLHEMGKTVYAYLNVGSIEEYRPYYEQFSSLTLDVYEDWPDERWIDVSNEIWQDFIVSELGNEIVEMGFDGFFIDNCDVYDQYETEEVYEGLYHILQALKEYERTILINGGDVFVSHAIEMEDAKNLMDGINQETVFTSIDFDTKTYAKQNLDDTEYFKEYLSQVKNEGFMVYLLEYGADEQLASEIFVYCEENGFEWYNAPSLELGIE